MPKPYLIICVFSLAIASAYPIKADADEPMTHIEGAWVLRSDMPRVIGKIKTVKEMMRWCRYEQAQTRPDLKPCEMVETLTQNSSENQETVDLVKASLKYLKAEPQTAIVKEHIASLTASLEEMLKLRSH